MEDESDDAPIRAVDLILQQAVQRGAAAVHIDPAGDRARVRLRLPGKVLCPLEIPPVSPALVACRLKIMAGLDISERRFPQDGTFLFTSGYREYRAGCMVLPTAQGESVSLRIQESETGVPSLKDAGAPEDVVAAAREALNAPGIVLIGASEAGRVTPLGASVLAEADASSRVVLAVTAAACALPEGVLPVIVNENFNAAAALFSVRRHDPDVVFADAVRDNAALSLVFELARDGACVLMALPVSDSAAALRRLLDMGADPSAAAELVRGGVFLHLYRRMCPHCRKQGPEGWRAEGCGRCYHGISGEAQAFESFTSGEALRRAVRQGGDLAQALAACGWRPPEEAKRDLIASGEIPPV